MALRCEVAGEEERISAESLRLNLNSSLARFSTDLRARYPRPSGSAGPLDHPEEPTRDNEFERRIGRLPAEIGLLLALIGIAGILLPGPVGSPFLLAGGLVLWPKAFGRVEGWFERRFPGLHREGVAQIERYLFDLERRYPGSIR